MAAINSIVGFITTSYETHGHIDLENWLIIAPNKIPKQLIFAAAAFIPV